MSPSTLQGAEGGILRRAEGAGVSDSVGCKRCGACCVGPDISALDKPLGARCAHLTAECLCAIYPERPRVCRDHRPDDICELVQGPTLEQRVQRYLAVFGLEEEAERNRRCGATSMREARSRKDPRA